MGDISNEYGCLRDILQQIPSSLNTILGEIIIPTDEGVLISESIVSGTCLGASDGSLTRGFNEYKGGRGYAL